MILHACEHAFFDSLKTLPFLFFAFWAMESLEHYSKQMTNHLFGRVGKAGPLLGAILGLIPQCGFSAAAANLYSGGVITLGTLLAVFLSTSDEAVLIFLAHPERGALIGNLLLAKLVIGLLAGYGVDLLRKKKSEEKKISDLCTTCGCQNEMGGVLRPALIHTLRMFVWLFVITLALNLIIEWVGTDILAGFLGHGSVVQPFLTALIGLIPNCASSVLLAELYLAGTLSFGATVAGLCSGAGLGLVVLFRMDGNKKECLKISALLYGIAVLAGGLLQAFGF